MLQIYLSRGGWEEDETVSLKVKKRFLFLVLTWL